MNKREYIKTVYEILDSLCDRSGFDDWYHNLDDDIIEEIELEMREIIEKRLVPKS